MTERVCANPPCENRFTPTRPHHVCCSQECRKAKWTLEHQSNGRTRSGGSRKPSRNGTGTRIYITPDDFNPDGSVSPSLDRKLDAAMERLLRKEHR